MPSTAVQNPCPSFGCDQDLWDCIDGYSPVGCPGCVFPYVSDISKFPGYLISCTSSCDSMYNSYNNAKCIAQLDKTCNISGINGK